MEILLAIVVTSAVIFFGALISMGNERQKNAIDTLREQIVLWAIQDLQIKRERISRSVQVENPLGWFKNIIAKVSKINISKLQILDIFEGSQAIMFSADENHKIVLCPSSLSELNQMSGNKQNRLSGSLEENPLLASSRIVKSFEISALNAGVMFDLELPFAWKGLTNLDIYQTQRIWMYILD